ncbi:recombinase family protein [Streptomyces goshikiensis]|uniref:recombinase family protein n=1 Tax=Streptomyces goshikiensis TaxID=1942 RepID=UPI0036C0205B
MPAICAVRWAGKGSRSVKVWLEQRSASKQHVRREKPEGAMAAVMAGEVKTLGVWKTDCFDRRGMAAIGTALDEFDRRRARLFVLQENLESSQPGARIVFAILAERAPRGDQGPHPSGDDRQNRSPHSGTLTIVVSCDKR